MGNLETYILKDSKHINLKIRYAIETASFSTLNWLRSKTSKTVPGVKKSEGPRFTRPGGWADITGQLANSYSFGINETGSGLEVEFSNNKEYSKPLDEKPGFWVLSGLLSEQAGSPFEKELMKGLEVNE